MKQLLVLSGKGGTGKTTVASAFIKLAKVKACADCDVDAPNLHLLMPELGEPDRAEYYGLPKAEIDTELCVQCGQCQQHCRFDAISFQQEYRVDPFACEGCGVCEVLCSVKAISLRPEIAGELRLYRNSLVFSTAQLKMGSGTSGLLVTEVKKRMHQAVENVKLAIIDGSPGIGCPVIASLSGVDMVLIVAEPSLSGICDMKRIVETAQQFQTKIVVCINKYDTNIKNTEKVEDFCQKMNISFAGRIPFDPMAVKAINSGISIIDIECPSGRAAKEIFSVVWKQLREPEVADIC